MTLFSWNEQLLSRGNPSSFRKQIEPSGGSDPSRCMFSSKKYQPLSYRTTKFQSNRHRKLQPFRS